MENQLSKRVVCGGKWITEQDIEEQYGKNREDAAATFKVSVSTFSRKYKEFGIKWPYPQRKSSRSKSALIGENVLHSSSQSGSKNKIASTNEETSQLLQMEETSSASSHQRKHQNSDIPIRQVIEGNNMPNSIIDDDVVDRMGAQPSLESISTQPSNSVCSIENTKLLFNNLIALPLEDLINPDNETSMRNALSILENNPSLFSKERANQILELSVEFPILLHSWRECYSRSHKYSQKSSAETEKIKDLVETSMKDEESLKVRYEELKNKEKELMRQLEAVQKEKAEIAEKKTEKSKQIKDLIEKEARRNKDDRLMRITTTKLNNLSDQWAKL